MKLREVRELGPAWWSPGAEPTFHRRERIGRVLARRDKMQGRTHEGRLQDLGSIDRAGEVVALESRKPRPQRDVRRRCPLALEAGKALDRIDHAEPVALEQKLPRQERAIQLTDGERGDAAW